MDKNNLNNFFNESNNKLEFISRNINDTIDIAKNFAKYLKVSDVVVLNGELGSGKTVFMQGIAKHFNIENEVSSPTFTIVNEYHTENINIYHFDVYRLEDEEQFINTIGNDYFENGISIIEWGNIIKKILPENTIYIDIVKIDESTRQIIIRRQL